MTALPKTDTNYTALMSLIPKITGNTFDSFSTHELLSAAKRKLVYVSRSEPV
jgi:hypothetical protein